jgi:Cu(I)/Ag(I) efflux system membrane fusion protein
MSKAVLELETTFGHTDGNYYEMYCPMAFDLKGASWLQRKETLENPYFGESMLRCGELKKMYDPNGGAE